MTTTTRYLARKAYAYAEANYGAKNARFDVIVECMTNSEIDEALTEEGITTVEGAIAWAKRTARLQHEVELNQAWDGPESCIGSSSYSGEWA